MAWLAPLIPIAYDMMRPKQGAPQIHFSRPDRSAYIDQLLKGGFDPQSALYKLASDRAMSAVDSSLAQRGIMGSAGEQMRAGTQTDLANKFLEGAFQRQLQAMNAVTNYDNGGLQVQNMNAEQDWRRAGLQEQRDRAMVGNLSGIGQVFTDKYYRDQERNDRLAEQQSNRDFYANVMNGTRASSGGTYYGQPSSPSYLGMDYSFKPYGG